MSMSMTDCAEMKKERERFHWWMVSPSAKWIDLRRDEEEEERNRAASEQHSVIQDEDERENK